METVLSMQRAHMQRGIMPVLKALYPTLYKRNKRHSNKKGHRSKKILQAGGFSGIGHGRGKVR